MQHRSLPEPFDLPIHVASKHEPEHLEVTQEGPKGVSQILREIPLYKQVAIKGTSIPRERDKEQEPPTEQEGTKEKENAEECSCEVPAPCGSLGVLVHVEGPEIFQAPKIHGLEGGETKNSEVGGCEFRGIQVETFLGVVEIADWESKLESCWLRILCGVSMTTVDGDFKL